MSSLTTSQIREAFLKFFESKQHRRVASSSLVPTNDPTLLFTVAGMVQFKDLFTGRETRDYTRAATAQKCVRAGGKHNDLENVGFTARHHTFFEMLGNFSFGDYFKADAITWAWEFVTQVIKIPVERLSVTVFKGEEGIPADDEARALWEKAGVPKHRVHALGLKDNFWAAGDTGPCGPCSEIYFYLPNHPVKEEEKPGESDNWLEIWNLVFMQFERKEAGGKLFPLPKPSIDTGAGLERVTSVVQGKGSNYDIDLFAGCLATVERLSKLKYGGTWNNVQDSAMRVIADHSRTAAFLIADGVQPSNEGRGYVLRRIMRRAIRHGDQTLDLSEPFFHETVDAIITSMHEAYPELKEKRDFVLEVTRHEEAAFRRTLRAGRALLMKEVARLEQTKSKVISGEIVWDLHQTFGFPWDLTEVMAKELDLSIDKKRFDALLDEERERQEKNQLNSTQAVADVYMKLAGSLPETKFLGYEGEGVTGTGKVLAILKAGVKVETAKTGETVEVVLDQTPFYGNSGGQVGDTGTMTAKGVRVDVLDVQKPAGSLFVHKVKVAEGTLAANETLTLQVDAERRNRIRANHSATHLLHRALKVVLGETVNQKGSEVTPEQLRFDFSTYQALTQEQIDRVEDLVNGWVRDNKGAETKVMGLAEARAAGAVALFGEKYGEKVRVVTVHPESTELCGGTHVFRSGDIGLFKIIEESAIAAGVRRIVAYTGAAAVNHFRGIERLLMQSAALYKAAPPDLPKRIETNQKRVKELEKKIEEVQLKAASASTDAESVQDVNGIKVLTHRVDGADANLLKQLADKYRDKLHSGVVGLGGATADGKAIILVAATKDLVDKGFKSGDAVKVMAAELGGKGGGRADMAQAGGTDPSKLPQAFEKLIAHVKGA
ncbi:MAG: alanine--tRNA ligase [Archangiaceae bacterium]|nr:alanine--tRNA ligase [Archangiaceae bacterium]